MILLWNVQKRPRDDSDPWNVAWPSDTHRRLEVLGDNKVVINWMNGAWEVKGDEHAVPVRGVVDDGPHGHIHPRQQPTHVCLKKDHPEVAFPASVSPDQSNQQEVCSAVLP